MLDACVTTNIQSLRSNSLSIQPAPTWLTPATGAARSMLRELATQIGILRSLVNALKFAATQNQWSSIDRAYLLKHLTLPQEQLFMLSKKLANNYELYAVWSKCKSAWVITMTAIEAINTTNYCKLVFALDDLSQELTGGLEIISKILRQ